MNEFLFYKPFIELVVMFNNLVIYVDNLILL